METIQTSMGLAQYEARNKVVACSAGHVQGPLHADLDVIDAAKIGLADQERQLEMRVGHARDAERIRIYAQLRRLHDQAGREQLVQQVASRVAAWHAEQERESRRRAEMDEYMASTCDRGVYPSQRRLGV